DPTRFSTRSGFDRMRLDMTNHRHLPDAQIAEIYFAALDKGLVNQQEALLAGLPPAYVSGLAFQGPSNGRLLETLHALNGEVALSNGTIPIVVWLDNAVLLTAGRSGCDVFEEALLALPNAPAERGSGSL